MVRERRWDGGEFGVSAVGVPAGVARFGAEVLLAADAEFAVPTGVPQPRDADAVTDRELVARVGPGLPTTSPTTSWPGITPGRCTGRSPSVTCRSVRHTPQARTATRSSPGAGLRNRRR